MHAVIDRFEGNLAVLLLGDEEIRLDLPVKYLPEGVREGELLEVGFWALKANTDLKRKEMEERLARLRLRGEVRPSSHDGQAQ